MNAFAKAIHLIASAPDLYEALIRCRTYIAAGSPIDAKDALLGIVEAAIAKGRT